MARAPKVRELRKKIIAQIFGEESWSRVSAPSPLSREARWREGVPSHCLVSGQLRGCSRPTPLMSISGLVAGSLGGLVRWLLLLSCPAG